MNCQVKAAFNVLPAKDGFVRLGLLDVGAEFRLASGRLGTVTDRGRDVETICEGQPAEVITFSPALEVIPLGTTSPNFARGRR